MREEDKERMCIDDEYKKKIMTGIMETKSPVGYDEAIAPVA